MSFKTALVACAAAFTFALPAFADGIEVHHAYARTAFPGGPSGAAFMVIHNHGTTDDQLIDARSNAAARVELHTHVDAGEGVMQMRHVPEGFPLPADGEIVMERGGNHVMFMGVKDTWAQGDLIPLTLVFQSGLTLDLEVEVDLNRTEMEHGAMDHGSMDHGSMDHGTMDHGTMDQSN